MQVCQRCGGRSKRAECYRCRQLGERERLALRLRGGEVHVDITTDDLRPDVTAALKAALAAEGGQLGRVQLVASVRWRAELYDDERWSGSEADPVERAAKRSAVLTHRAGAWLRRWLAVGRPRPRLDDDWLDGEVALVALGGEPLVDESMHYYPRLLRPWREMGSVRACLVCGADLVGRRPDATTCSTRCRVARHRGSSRMT